MFLPASVLIPVFPPTAASTMPSSVVGTWTTRTPRIQVGRREAGDVGDGAAAETDHHIGSIQSDPAEDVPAEPKYGKGFRVLAVRHLDHRHVGSGVDDRFPEPICGVAATSAGGSAPPAPHRRPRPPVRTPAGAQ